MFELGAERATRKPNRAIIDCVLCRLSYLGVMEPGVRIELTISCSQNKRIASNAYPAEPGAGAGIRTPVSSVPKMCPIQTGRRQQYGAGWSYSKTQPPPYESGALPLELHQRNMERSTRVELVWLVRKTSA